jgi:two-component system NtrC family response regulator
MGKMGFIVQESPDGSKILDQIHSFSPGVILLDIRMPDYDGIELLQQIKENFPAIEVVMLTGYGTLENGLRSMKMGAYDFLTKPCNLDKLEQTLLKAHQKYSLNTENEILKRELDLQLKSSKILGNSSAIKTVLNQISRVAPTDSTVLIEGESGTGKELIARAIWENSFRRNQPFIVLDCGTFTENLLENELFGHERGAFTGAHVPKPGLFEIANGGTIFLDEIANVYSSVQAKLLRVLETRRFRRLGGTKDTQINVRFIAATNADLRKEIQNGNFRKDLFYRLNVFHIMLPPLRERREDIPLLVKYFISRTNLPGKRSYTISKEAMDLLVKYPWPGNVRELENVIERALIIALSKTIDVEDLPLEVRGEDNYMNELFSSTSLLSLSEMKDLYIKWVLKKAQGNQTRAAEILKINPKTIYRLLNKKKL